MKPSDSCFIAPTAYPSPGPFGSAHSSAIKGIQCLNWLGVGTSFDRKPRSSGTGDEIFLPNLVAPVRRAVNCAPSQSRCEGAEGAAKPWGCRVWRSGGEENLKRNEDNVQYST